MITHKIKNLTILALFVLLLISGGLNIWQNKVRKAGEFQAMLDMANSNTLITQKTGQIAMRDSAIAAIRKERAIDSLKSSIDSRAFKAQIGKLRFKISQLPQKIVYNPDSATVDSLRVSFALKDSVIDTQALMIMNLETEKQGLFASFTREVQQLTDNRNDQIVITNQLQNQLVESQSDTRKEKRKRKFWRTVSVAAAGGIAFLLLKPN